MSEIISHLPEKTSRTSHKGGMEHSFGFEIIEPEKKQEKVNDVFHSVAKKYDIMNDIMSLGMHRLWKDQLINKLCPHKYSQWHLLDVAGGTGDIALKALKATNNNPEARITLLDINSSMLEIGKEKALKANCQDKINFVEGDAQNLPFADNNFDAYSIAFGIRNVPHIDKALAEAYRVLKFGGKFICLEFSQLNSPILEKLYDIWSFKAIPYLGKLITNDQESYQYLVESIRKFPNQEDFRTMIHQAGFKKCNYYNLTGGIATIHEAWKI